LKKEAILAFSIRIPTNRITYSRSPVFIQISHRSTTFDENNIYQVSGLHPTNDETTEAPLSSK
jgi:hypothetical protein